MEETKAGGPFKEILKHDIFVNCIYLSNKIPPFLTKEMLDDPSRVLSVIADVSCDATNPNNPIPVYFGATTFDDPLITIKTKGYVMFKQIRRRRYRNRSFANSGPKGSKRSFCFGFTSNIASIGKSIRIYSVVRCRETLSPESFYTLRVEINLPPILFHLVNNFVTFFSNMSKKERTAIEERFNYLEQLHDINSLLSHLDSLSLSQIQENFVLTSRIGSLLDNLTSRDLYISVLFN
jgi:hypothetical protein